MVAAMAAACKLSRKMVRSATSSANVLSTSGGVATAGSANVGATAAAFHSTPASCRTSATSERAGAKP
eukprot:11074894-Heterocapsa_arctica.AAC.1